MSRSSATENNDLTTASRAGQASAAHGQVALNVSFCSAPWEMWRKISARADAPFEALKLVENTPFRVEREWHEPGQSSLRELGTEVGGAERAVTQLEWMASSGQVRWDSERSAVILTHLMWLRLNGLASVDRHSRTLVLGDGRNPAVRPDTAEAFSDRLSPA